MGQTQKFDMNEFLPESGMTRRELVDGLQPAIADIKEGRSVTTAELEAKYERRRADRLRKRRGNLLTR